jgi:hypothetical protein
VFGHNVCYVAIPELDDGELDDVARQLGRVADVIALSTQLRSVVRNLFRAIV